MRKVEIYGALELALEPSSHCLMNNNFLQTASCEGTLMLCSNVSSRPHRRMIDGGCIRETFNRVICAGNSQQIRVELSTHFRAVLSSFEWKFPAMCKHPTFAYVVCGKKAFIYPFLVFASFSWFAVDMSENLSWTHKFMLFTFPWSRWDTVAASDPFTCAPNISSSNFNNFLGLLLLICRKFPFFSSVLAPLRFLRLSSSTGRKCVRWGGMIGQETGHCCWEMAVLGRFLVPPEGGLGRREWLIGVEMNFEAFYGHFSCHRSWWNWPPLLGRWINRFWV